MLDFYINFKINLKICYSVFLYCSYFHRRNEYPHDKTDKVTYVHSEGRLRSDCVSTVKHFWRTFLFGTIVGVNKNR